jgi:hypothetical protein
MTTKKSTPSRAKATPAVYLHSLEVENMRVFGRRQRLDFCTPDGRLAQWTFILAQNGYGKTTLLRAIVEAHTMAVNTFPGPRLSFPPPQQLPARNFFQRSERQEVFICLNWTSVQKLGSAVDEEAIGSLPFSFTYSYEIISERKILGRKSRISNTGLPVLGLMFLIAYGAPRRVPGASARMSKRNDQTFQTLYDEDAYLRDPQSWLFETDISERHNGKAGSRLALVQKILADILPGVSEVRIGFDAARRPEAQFKTEDGWIPFDDMSHGYKTMMGWVVDFASRMVQRYPKSKNPLHEPAVVLVDEIDLHLHPKWQRQLIDALTRNFPRTQFIATAHSPLVVQAAEGANLAVLRRDPKTRDMLIDNEPANIEGWRIDQILTSDLFGIESARSPKVERSLDRRTQLIQKQKLTAAEKRELAALNSGVDRLPVMERREDQKLLDLLRKMTDGNPDSAPAQRKGAAGK